MENLTASEQMYAKHPKRVEHTTLALSASEAVCAALAETGLDRKQLRKAVGWKRKKLERVLNNDKITLKQIARLLFALGYRANLTITEIPTRLRQIVSGKEDIEPVIETS